MKTQWLALCGVISFGLTATPGYAQAPIYPNPNGYPNPAAGYYGQPPGPPVPVVAPGAMIPLPPAAPQPSQLQSVSLQPAVPLPAPEYVNMNFDLNFNGSKGNVVGAPAPPPPSSRPANDPVAPAVAFQEDRDSQGFWTFGGGVYFMTPYYTSNPAFFTGNGANFGISDFHQHMSVAPLSWLGYTWDNGWGIRGRWFQFNGSSQAGFTANPNITEVGIPTGGTMPLSAGSTVTASNTMSLNAYDLEATNHWLMGRWSILASAGVRYVHYNQNYQFTAIDSTFGNTAASSGNNFSGAGPTLNLELRRLIGNDNPSGDGSRFWLYGSARGSLLYGASHQYAAGDLFASDPGFTASQTTVVSVGELEIGAEWTRTCGRFRFFTQAAFIGQAWCGGNNATAGISEFNFGTGILSNFGFVGGVVRAGISF